MDDVFAQLVSELKTLRKGRGLFVSEIDSRVGPVLRRVCDVTDEDGPAETRRKIATWLERQAAELPPDLRIAIMGAFAVDQDARLPLYQDRVGWISTRLGREPRSARRRIDDAIHHIADLAARAMRDTSTEHPDQGRLGWHTEELRVSVLLDRPSPQVVEFRRIVAEHDGLDELDLALTVTRAGEHGATPDDLTVDVFHGGTLIETRRESSSRVGMSLRLPDPLILGQTHEFMLHYWIGPGRELQPHYVCVPKYRCDRFDLHVRFGTNNRPRTLQRIAGLFQADVTDPLTIADTVRLDRAGEAHASFRQLTPGMAYGLRWKY